jgi:hypothetical protein
MKAPHGVTNLTWPTPPDDSLYLADAFSRYLAERTAQRKPFLGTYRTNERLISRLYHVEKTHNIKCPASGVESFFINFYFIFLRRPSFLLINFTAQNSRTIYALAGEPAIERFYELARE